MSLQVPCTRRMPPCPAIVTLQDPISRRATPCTSPSRRMTQGQFPKVLETIGVEESDLLLWLEGAGADQPPKDLFVLDGPSGHLSVTAPLDREQHAGFQLHLRAASSDGQISHSLWIAVTVTDQNDNAPRFLWQDITAHVLLSAAPGTLVAVVQAEDADDQETLYGQVSHTLTAQRPGSPAARIFTVNNTSGAIHTHRALPKTDDGVFVLEVTARDCGGAEFGRSDKAIVTVIIADSISTAAATLSTSASQPRVPEPEEDESMVLLGVQEPSDLEAPGGGIGCPVFSLDAINVEMPEELPPGQKLLTVRTAENIQIIELRLEGDRAGWLSVDAATGEVATRASLDRESPHVVNDTYLVAVVAVTHGACTASVALLLRLEDVNDHAPQPSPPLLLLCQVLAYGDATLSATDADGPSNGAPFTFHVLPTNAHSGGDGWMVAQPNGSTAVLVPRVPRLSLGERSLPVSVCDRRGLCRQTSVGVVVRACHPPAASAVVLPLVLGLAALVALAIALVCCARVRARSKSTRI
ncbi:cadherin-2-like isoform X2 [Lethenteron reissneri]|uniref:cadherin-2-like isoform X2 n=1 Tax=Lethenteron reissneri TaxID=7753 RepID=UPI002AB7DA16|nr:cadherin-2-like isoform X2 [Lethenteron reissneri]